MDSEDFERHMRALEYIHSLRVKVDRDLPMKGAYAAFIGGLLDAADAEREEQLQRRRKKGSGDHESA